MRFVKKYPIINLFHHTLFTYPAPSNLSYLWNFGVLALVCLAFQILTGIFLAMHYVPHADLAFSSVEHIMRDVNFGWLLRYLHANGASMFFLVVYFHVFRGLYYSSYTAPRELLWCTGVIILLLMILTAFLGYVLPWGQMSFWAATVITNLASAIPFGIGDYIVTWLWGGFSVGHATLNRFFSLHYLFPFLILALSFIHLVLLHENGSNNPLGVGFKSDNLSFGPYYLVKDLFGIVIFLLFYFFFCYFMPNYLGHSDNYIMANPLVTPSHIVPEWYFLPFYAILRSVPDKLLGVLLLLGAIFILLLLPFFIKVHIRSLAFRPLMKIAFWFFFVDCVLLGWLGGKPIESPYLEIGKLSTLFYFYYFLLILPFIKLFENFIWFEEKSLIKSKFKIGALTSKPYSFQARPWELISVETYDLLDGYCSAVRVDLRGSKILRILPANNSSLNQQWISDRIRFSYDSFFLNRLIAPFLKNNNKLIESSWDVCFNVIQKLFLSLKTSRQLSFISGSTSDFFSLLFFKNFMSFLGSNNFFFQKFSNLRENYFFNKNILSNLLNSISFFSTNIRIDSPVLFLRLRKSFSLNFSIFLYGPLSYRINFQTVYMGNGISNLLTFIFARSNVLSNFDLKTNANFWGSDFPVNNLFLLKSVKHLFSNLYFVSDSILSNNSMEINFFSRFNFINKKDSLCFFFFNEDSLDFVSSLKKKVSIFIGTHLPKTSLDLDIFLPYVSFFEDTFIFFNNFGTFFKTSPVIKSNKKSILSVLNLHLSFAKKLISFVNINILFSFWYLSTSKSFAEFFFSSLQKKIFLLRCVMLKQLKNNFYSTNMWTKNSWNLTMASKYFFKKKKSYND